MEALTPASILLSLLCVVIVTVIAKALNFLWLTPKKQDTWLRQQGFPGTSYRLLFGNLKEYNSMRAQALDHPMSTFTHDYLARLEPFRYELITKFGREFFMWFGPLPVVNISKPELLREAFTKLDEFQKINFNPILRKLFPGFIHYDGEQWALHRRIVNPAFHMEKLKKMMPAFYESCAEMIEKWEKQIEAGASDLDVWPYIAQLSADVISRAAFGSSYAEGQRIFQLLREQLDLGLRILESVYIPGIMYIPTARNRRFKQIDAEIQTSLMRIINKRKQAMEAGEAPKSDLLGILMDSNLKEIQQDASGNNKNRQLGMSLQEVIEDCKLFYLAGQETTSLLIVWTLILLSKHQDWQERARQEILKTFGHDPPHFEGLSHLKTVTMILYEVLRLYPPNFQVGRITSKDTKLGEFSFPAGVILNFQVLSIHQDKELWGEDADEFKPERFSEGISKATRGNNSYFPFGSGPRICIGEKFAVLEAKTALSMILQRFSLQLSPSYAHAPRSVVFLQPQYGARLILHRL